jgi:hypothetical protein
MPVPEMIGRNHSFSSDEVSLELISEIEYVTDNVLTKSSLANLIKALSVNVRDYLINLRV